MGYDINDMFHYTTLVEMTDDSWVARFQAVKYRDDIFLNSVCNF